MSHRLAIIGASYLQLPLVLKARKMGLATLCFAWPEGAVCKEHCDEFVPGSIIVYLSDHSSNMGMRQG